MDDLPGWTAIEIGLSRRVACSKPFSFFFDLVGKVWLSPDCDPAPFRRICTLARKQGVTFAVLENASARPDVHADVAGMEQSNGGGGRAEAVAISFFACANPDEDLQSVGHECFLGQVIVVNYLPAQQGSRWTTYVFEAVLASQRLMGLDGWATLTESYASRARTFACQVGGQTFTLLGTYFCQQNYVTHACAHASLRMAVNTLQGLPALQGEAIDAFLGGGNLSSGLSIRQIEDAIEEFSGCEPEVFQCEKDGAVDYLRVLASVVESGDMALLVFTTGTRGIEHVVVVLGHARASGEWHPLGLPAYARRRSQQFYTSSEWISHFLIHDDALGPYYSLNARAFELNPKIKAQWIVALRPRRPTFNAPWAQACGITALENAASLLQADVPGEWLEMMRMKPPGYVLRPILLSRESYLDHLREAEAHDGSRSGSNELAVLAALPPHLWIVEYTLPQLYDGNRSKIGEVVLDASSDPAEVQAALREGKLGPALAGFRAPGLIALSEAGSKLQFTSSGIVSHVPTYRFRNQC